MENLNEEIKRFLDRHHLDWFRDIGGCETCGPEYEWNCSCGESGMDGYGFTAHQREMVDAWDPYAPVFK